jgi:type 2 lantibiotic biosynthesis protein LanM
MTVAERRAIAIGALTIYERLAAQPRACYEVERLEEGRGRHVLKSWNQAFSPGDAAAFARRLEWDGIQPLAVMAASAADDLPDLNTDWIAWIERFSAGARAVLRDMMPAHVVSSDGVREDVVPHGTPGGAASDHTRAGGEETPFAELWTACVRGVRRLCVVPDSARITLRGLDDLAGQLMRELAVYGERPLYHLFDVARAFRRSHEIEQDAAAGSALYREFIIHPLNEQFAALFREYPVAGRQMARVAQGWVHNTGTLLERLAADRQTLARVFNGNADLGPVERVEAGLSDPHDGRQRVAVLAFAAGVRVVYKPRDLRVDGAFERLVAWFAHHGLESTPPAPRVVLREGYGWAEYVDQGEFTSHAAVARYFEQAGALIFLAHLLGARDLHMENLIASDAGPTLIDLELLVQPSLRSSVAFTEGTTGEDLTRIGESVLRTGLLSLVQIGPDDQPYDLGGLRGTGRTSSGTRRRWMFVGTDALTFREEPAPALPVKNAVRFGRRIEPPEHYVAEIVRGFERAYRIAVDGRRELLHAAGPLTCFQSAEIRIIARPTEQYGLLSAMRSSPRYQRDGIANSLLVDALYRPLKELRVRPRDWPLVIAERRAIEALDVPRFVVSADGLTVCSSGTAVLPDYYGQSALDAVRGRIAHLSDIDREAQSRILRYAITQNIATRFSQPCPVEMPLTSDQNHVAIAAVLPAVATWIGDELLCQLPGAGGTGPDECGRRLEAHLFYNGSIGAGVFFSALARMTGATRWGTAARQSLGRCLDFVGRRDFDSRIKDVGIGGLAGLGSLVQGLTYAGGLLNDATILDAAHRVAGRIDGRRIASDQAHDIVDGAAGALLAVLTLHDATRDQALLEIAVACGDHLIAAQVAREAGAGWPSARGGVLAGFAHGAAGISTALLRLSAATGRAVYRDAAVRGLEFVSSLFSPTGANWPISESDDDNVVGTVGGMNAWCHGAPGIALAAAEAVEVAPTLALVQQAQRALAGINRWDLAQADHLCCGHLGRADVLLTTGGRLGVASATGAAYVIAARVLARARRHQHFRLSTPGVEYRVLDPGFFRGLSGIGYQLLRLSAPGRLPSVLAFQAVPRADSA